MVKKNRSIVFMLESYGHFKIFKNLNLAKKIIFFLSFERSCEDKSNGVGRIFLRCLDKKLRPVEFWKFKWPYFPAKTDFGQILSVTWYVPIVDHLHQIWADSEMVDQKLGTEASKKVHRLRHRLLSKLEVKSKFKLN